MALPTLDSFEDVYNAAKNAAKGVGQATNSLDPKNLVNPKTKHESTVRDLVDWAGWNGKDIDTMTAVVLAEGGSEIDHNGDVICRANFAGCCWGPFQINLSAWKVDKSLACDPAKAAKFSHDTIFKSQGFAAWEAFTNGSYQKFKGQNKKINVDKGVFGGGTDEQGPGGVSVPDLSPGNAIKGLVDLVQKIFDPSTWLRFGKIIFGVILFLIGIGALLVIAGKPLMQTAAKNSPGGKAFLFQRTKVST